MNNENNNYRTGEVTQLRRIADAKKKMTDLKNRTRHFRNTMDDAYDYLKKIGYLK